MIVAWRRGNIRQVIFAARYGAHLGNYMMHCHNIVHEDHDMLRAFLVRTCRLLYMAHRPWFVGVPQHLAALHIQQSCLSTLIARHCTAFSSACHL